MDSLGEVGKKMRVSSADGLRLKLESFPRF